MPRKINKRKAIQAAKRKVAAEAEGRKKHRWAGIRRSPDEKPRVGFIAHRSVGPSAALLTLALLALRRSEQVGN